nr:MAG TPA: hypothetical protein [Caudoviricetes sp.]
MAKYGGFRHWCFLIVLHATKNSSLSGFVGAFSQCFLFAIYTVFQTEHFSARWCNFKIQASPVR